MAMQAHHEPLSVNHEAGAAANNGEYTHYIKDVNYDEAMKQSTSAHEDVQQVVDSSLRKISEDPSMKINEEYVSDLLQPARSRLRCRVLQINTSLIYMNAASADPNSDDEMDVSAMHNDQSVLMNNVDAGRVEEVEGEASDMVEEANSVEEEEELELGCVTPTAREQRIPASKDLVCPPPPIKKKPTAFKRIGVLRPHRRSRNLLINPPDLHTLPACIRALFDK